MNPEPTDRRDADALDVFWDELVFDQITGRIPRAATSANEEMVMNLRSLMSTGDDSAETRLRQLVFGSPPEPAMAAGPSRPLPIARPEPARPARSSRRYARLAAAALTALLVGALVAAQNGSLFGFRGGNEGPTAIPAAVSHLDATPAVLGTPTAANDSILWALPFEGTNVEAGATALADGTLYRLIRSDEFTGVQAIDTVAGTEKWRSAQPWQGNGLGADENGVYLLTAAGVTALEPQTGELRWNAVTLIAAWSMAMGDGRVYLWDGSSMLDAIDSSDGAVIWQGVADVDTATTKARASQPPAVTERGVAAVSGTGTVALFDTEGNFTGATGNLHPESVELAATASGDVAVAGAPRLATDQPWARKLLLVNPADGSTTWETDYNATVTGLIVADSMVLILADNGGMAYSATEDDYQYPEQTSPQIYGYDLETGQMHFTPDPEQQGSSHGWVSDKGSSPYVALANGPTGPIVISESGQLDFYSRENPLVQAVVRLPGVLPNQVIADESAVFVSLADGTVTAVAPQLASLESHPITASGMINWTIPPVGTLVTFGGMTYGDGLVLRLIDTGSGRQIEATYALTGQPSWTLPFDWSTNQIVADPGPDPNDSAQTWTGSGNIFVVDAENRLIGIDGASGTLAWQHAFERPVVSMIYDADTLYVWDESGTMTAFLPQDGMVLWATTPGEASGSQNNELGMPIPAVTRTTIAMVDADGTLHGFSKELGDLLWSTPGFDGTNSRITRQGIAASDQTEVFIVVSAQGGARSDGTFEQTVSGVLAQSGQRIWDSTMQGPLVQPVNTDETLVVVTANQLLTGKNVPAGSTPIVDGESYNHFEWTSSGEATPESGGQRLFALQADTGEIVWIRGTAAGGFTDLGTKFPGGSGWLYAVTSDGLLVSPNRGNGAIDSAPTDLGGPVLAVISSGETGAIGSFATLADGALISFGGMPFSQQG